MDGGTDGGRGARDTRRDSRGELDRRRTDGVGAKGTRRPLTASGHTVREILNLPCLFVVPSHVINAVPDSKILYSEGNFLARFRILEKKLRFSAHFSANVGSSVRRVFGGFLVYKKYIFSSAPYTQKLY